MSATTAASAAANKTVKTLELDEIVVRFVGDSGDGMQLAGTQMTNTSAVLGNDVATLPDFPAEIRAPAGSLAGVSGFQINFSSHDIRTPGDQVNCLVAMNPAGLKSNIADLEPGGILLVNEDAFNKVNLQKAGYTANPLDDGSLKGFRLFRVPLDKLTTEANKGSSLTSRALGRCRNFTALGLVYWMFNRPLDETLRWIDAKFGKKPEVAEANRNALKTGYYFGETCETFIENYKVPKARITPGRYRKLTGNEALAIGLVTAARLAGKDLFYGTYPITPASDILHQLSTYKNFGVMTFQAEDEIAAMTSVIGAAFAGAIAVTGTSGPGIALKAEGIGLAVCTELPVIIINVQRGGPSTGLPTKTEQADLLQAVCGRNGECPVAVLAPNTPADCFNMAIEACRIAIEYMTPVMLLSDGYLANGAEPWRIPDEKSLPHLKVTHPAQKNGESEFLPYKRDAKLARPWALPGTPGLEHRIGGLEKEDVTGHVSYDPENHEHMVKTRAAKIAGIAKSLPKLEVLGSPQGGDLLVIGWGSTYGAITTAVERCRAQGMDVSSVHLRYLNPFQQDLGDVLKRFKRVLCPEMNLGQLSKLLRAEFLVDVKSLSKVQGKPFMVRDIVTAIESMMKGNNGR